MTKIWKTTITKEYFNEIWPQVGEHESIYITEIKFWKKIYIYICDLSNNANYVKIDFNFFSPKYAYLSLGVWWWAALTQFEQSGRGSYMLEHRPGGGTPMSITQDVPQERPPFLNLLVHDNPLFENYWLPTTRWPPFLKCSILIDGPLFISKTCTQWPHFYFKGLYPMPGPNDPPYFKVIV